MKRDKLQGMKEQLDENPVAVAFVLGCAIDLITYWNCFILALRF